MSTTIHEFYRSAGRIDEAFAELTSAARAARQADLNPWDVIAEGLHRFGVNIDPDAQAVLHQLARKIAPSVAEVQVVEGDGQWYVTLKDHNSPMGIVSTDVDVPSDLALFGAAVELDCLDSLLSSAVLRKIGQSPLSLVR